MIPKYGRDRETSPVFIYLGVFRLSHFETDILVTFNASARDLPDPLAYKPVFEKILQSLRMIDPSLFG